MAAVSRSKTRIYDVSYSLRSGSSTGGWPNPPWSRTKLEFVRVDSVTHDGPVYQFRKRIARSENATTSLNGTRYKVEHTNGFVSRRVFDSVVKQFILHEAMGDMCQSTSLMSLPSFTNSLSADNQAKMSFVGAVRSAQTALTGGVVLGELRETLRMIRNPAQALRRGVANYFTDLQKNRRGSKRARQRVLSNTWLEHSFGWKPLISDIESGCLLLDRMLYYPPRQPVRGVGKAQTAINPTYHTWNPHGATTIKINRQSKSETIVVYRGAVRLDPSDSPAFRWRQAGLTLDHFVPTLWELVPWSFLVDYFTNIGEIIDAWSLGRMNLNWSNKTVIEVSSCELTPIGCDILISSGQTDGGSGFKLGRHKTELRRVVRGPYTGSFIPDFRWEIPGSGSLKWLNIAALASTRARLTPF